MHKPISPERIARLIEEDRAHFRTFCGILCRDGNKDDAEDLLAESSIKAIRFAHKYDPAKSFRNWFMRVINNTCVDLWRKDEKRRERTISLEMACNKDAIGGVSAGFFSEQAEDAIFEDKTSKLPFDNVLSEAFTIPEMIALAERVYPLSVPALILTAVDDMTNVEAAKLLGLDSHALCSRLHKLKRKVARNPNNEKAFLAA